MSRFPRLRLRLLTAAVAGTAAFAAHAAEVHEHGVSRLDAAIEGNNVMVSLQGPGHNFVGFEHEASTDDEIKAVREARSQLENATTLIGLPGNAQCRIGAVDISIQEDDHEDHDHDHDHDHAHAHGDKDHDRKDKEHGGDAHAHAHDHDHDHEHDHGHNDWRADYRFECQDTGAIDRITVNVFKTFPQTESVRWQLVSPKGQTGGTLTANDHVITLP